MQKALQQMNIRLDKAVSDITGKTGLEIVNNHAQRTWHCI
jgi:hypothetical protein